MSAMDALIEAGKIARIAAASVFFRRLVSHMATVVFLSVLTGILAGALLITGFYVLWWALIQHGAEANVAAFIIMGIAAMAALISALLTRRAIHRMKRALSPIPPMPEIKRIARSFAEGFTED